MRAQLDRDAIEKALQELESAQHWSRYATASMEVIEAFGGVKDAPDVLRRLLANADARDLQPK